MSATRAILFGAALGFAAGAAAIAQETNAAADIGAETQLGDMQIVTDLDADLDVETTTTTDTGPAATQMAGTTPNNSDGMSLMAEATALIGKRVYDPNDEWVGEIAEILPASDATEERVIVDMGGFLGFGETPVEVSAEALTILYHDTGEIDHAVVAMTEAELQAMANAQS